MRKSSELLMLLVVLVLLAAACGDSSGDDTTTAAPEDTTAATDTSDTPITAPATETTAGASGITCDEPVTVGVITDQTGALAIYGSHMNRGVPIGFAYATGSEVQGDGLTSPEQTYMLDDCEIRVVFKDDQTNAELSAAAARELIEVNGADIIIGSISSGATSTLQDIARERNVILIAAPVTATDLTGMTFDPNTFRASRSNYQDAMAICDQFVNGDGYETFVQVAPDYSFGYGGAQAYRDACGFYGGEFIADNVFAPAGTTDFTSYLTPLADTAADAFLVTWTGGGFVRLVESAIALGVIDDDTVLGSPFVDNLVMPGFFSNAIGTTSVIPYHYTAPSNPINDYLIANQEAVGGAYPDLFDADGMNAALMVVAALKAANGAADADSLRAALEGMTFDGPKGVIEIRAEDHMAIQDMYIVTLLNVDSPEFRYFENVATLRPEPPCLLEGEYVTRCGSLPVGSLGG